MIVKWYGQPEDLDNALLAALAAVQQETQEACAKIAANFAHDAFPGEIATAIRAQSAPKAPRPEAISSDRRTARLRFDRIENGKDQK